MAKKSNKEETFRYLIDYKAIRGHVETEDEAMANVTKNFPDYKIVKVFRSNECRAFDPKTFGDSPACLSLAKMLSAPGSKKYSRKVSRLLEKFNAKVLKLKMIPRDSRHDKCIVRGMLWCIYSHYRDAIDKLELPVDIKSHVLNVLSYYYRITNKII